MESTIRVSFKRIRLTRFIVLGVFALGVFAFLMSKALWADQVASSLKSGSNLEIDQIQVLGVTVFPSETIESTIEISPGDRLEHLKVIRTEENLQTLYSNRGYEDVRITSRLVRKGSGKNHLETVLEFKVTEGRPVRVASVKLVPEGLRDEGSLKTWRLRESQVRKAIGIWVGDVYDIEKIGEAKRAVQDLLASKEFIGTKVDSVRAEVSAPAHVADLKLDAKNVARWVEVEFHVDLGERVSFGFRGNTVFTWGYLDNLVEEQRLLGLGKDYVGAIKARLEAEYRAAGYARVELTPYTIEVPNRYERKVTYVIREGPRVKIDSISFDGNSAFSEVELRQRFFSRASSLVQHGVYVEKDVQKACELTIESMKETGYLSAKLINVNSIELPASKAQAADRAVKLVVYIYEGDQTLIQGVNIEGVRSLALDEVKQLLGMQEGDPLNLFLFGERIEAIKKHYRDLGYLGFKILNEGTDKVIRYFQENRLASIQLNIDEGPQYKVSRIEIEGLQATHEHVVRRELRFNEGEVLTGPALSETERLIRRLGIFSEVVIRAFDDPDNSGFKIVRINLKEGDRGILSWGPGFRNDLGLRLFGQLAYANVGGLNHTASVTAAVNRRFYNYNFAEGQVQVLYNWPWFLVPLLTFRPSVSVGQTQYINFSAAVLTGSTSWEKQIWVKPNLTANFSYTLEIINQFNTVDGTENGGLQIGTMTPKLVLDLRDNSLAPRSGLFATTWLDLAQAFLGSGLDSGSYVPISYYRFQFRTDYYIPINRDITWFLSFRTGFEQSGAGQEIPLLKQFTQGGLGSLRGYREQELFNNGTLVGASLAYVNYRTQLDLPFAGPLKCAPFIDAANLLINNFSFGGLRYGVGFGFHYLTPVGPVNVDLGFKVDPPQNTDVYQVHFSVGVI